MPPPSRLNWESSRITLEGWRAISQKKNCTPPWEGYAANIQSANRGEWGVNKLAEQGMNSTQNANKSSRPRPSMRTNALRALNFPGGGGGRSPGCTGRLVGGRSDPSHPPQHPLKKKKLAPKRKISGKSAPPEIQGWLMGGGGGVVGPPTSHRVWGIPVQPGRSRFTSWEVSSRVGSRGCCTKKKCLDL